MLVQHINADLDLLKYIQSICTKYFKLIREKQPFYLRQQAETSPLLPKVERQVDAK